MATWEVSTWAQLKNAVTIAQQGDLIKLIADIDCNDEIPEGVASTVTSLPEGFNIDGGYTEDGVQKRHEIRNLRTSVSTPVTIFQFGFNNTTITHRVRNIDFINLVLDKPLFGVKDYYVATHNFYVINCRFTGKRTTNLVERIPGQGSGSAQGYVNVYLQRSYFNIPYYGTDESGIALSQYYNQSGSYFYPYVDNCRIRTHYTGTYTPAYHAGDVYSEIYHMNMSGCRVEGDIAGHAPDTYSYINFHLVGGAGSRTPPMQNVYDVDFYIMAAISNRNIDFDLYKGVVKRPVKVLNSTTIYDTYNAKASLIFATEAQMQDIDWLIQHNFDVVPSNV